MRGRSDVPLALVARDDAEQKLSAANALHATKVRSLMNSINKLQKENAQLKKDSLEHQRSKAFQRVQAELGHQDIMLNALKDVLVQQKTMEAMNEIDEPNLNERQKKARETGEKYFRQIIQNALERGPPRYRPKTREELKHELDDKKEALSNARTRLQKAREHARSVPVAWGEEDPGSPKKGVSDGEEGGGEKEKLEHALAISQSKLDAVTRENDSFRIECKSLQRVVEKQTEELGRLQRGVLQRAGGGSDRDQIAIMEQKLQLKDGEVKRLREYKEQVEKTLDAKAKEALALGKEAGDFAAQNAKQKADSDEAQRDVAVGLNQKLIEANRKFADYEADTQKTISTLKENLKDRKALLSQIEADAKKAESENARMKREMQSLQDQSSTQELAVVKDYEKLKHAKEKLDEEFRAKDDVHRAQLEKERANWDHQRKELEGKLEKSRSANDDQRADLENVRQQAEAGKEELHALQKERDAAQSELNKKGKDLATAKLGLEASEAQINKYMFDLEQRARSAVTALVGKNDSFLKGWILGAWHEFLKDAKTERKEQALKAAQAEKMYKYMEDQSGQVALSATFSAWRIKWEENRIERIKDPQERERAKRIAVTSEDVQAVSSSTRQLQEYLASQEDEPEEPAEPGEPVDVLEGSEDPMDDRATEDDFQVNVGWYPGVANAVKVGYSNVDQKWMVDLAEHPDQILWARHIQPRDERIKELERNLVHLQDEFDTQKQEIESLRASEQVDYEPEELLRAYDRADELSDTIQDLQEENQMLQKQLTSAQFMIRKARSRSASPAVHHPFCPYCEHCRVTRAHRGYSATREEAPLPAPSQQVDDGAGVGGLSESPNQKNPNQTP